MSYNNVVREDVLSELDSTCYAHPNNVLCSVKSDKRYHLVVIIKYEEIKPVVIMIMMTVTRPIELYSAQMSPSILHRHMRCLQNIYWKYNCC